VLCRRIEERFPERGLHRVCLDLLRVAQEAEERARWVGARPHWPICLPNALVMATLIWLLGALLLSVHFDVGALFALSPADFLQTLEAGLNDLVLIGAALFFFGSLETRFKRARAPLLPPREEFSLFELSRYLDYCSEMLALIGKIAALYLQEFPDPVTSAAMNEIEKLTMGLSRKIWQKISILQSWRNCGEVGMRRRAWSRGS